MMNILTKDLEIDDAARVICDAISYDYFADMRGHMKQFLEELENAKEAVALLISDRRINDEGNFAESDEDDQGNLR